MSEWEKPTEKFPTAEEAVRWFIKRHFSPTSDASKHTWASDLYATYLDAASKVELPLISSARFGRALSTMVAHEMTVRVEDTERRSGKLYAVEPLEGIELFRLGKAGRGAIHTLYRAALQRTGSRSWVQTQTQDGIARENDLFLKNLTAAGYRSTIERARKRAGVTEEINEARLLRVPTMGLWRKLEGNRLAADIVPYVRWLALLRANYVVDRMNNGRRSQIVTVEKVEGT